MQKKLLYFLVFLCIISCKRETSPPNPTPDQAKKCRLVKMIQGTNNGAGYDSTFMFYYDASGKLTKVTYQNPGYNQNSEYLLSYDDSGRLIKISSPGPPATYTYTTNGLLSNMYSFRLSDSIRRRFVYGSSAIPEKCIEYKRSFVTKQWDSVEHRYTVQNGNITALEAFVEGVSKNKAFYEYDTIPNLNATLSLISQWTVPLGLYEEILPFNKNMLKKKTIANANGHYVGQGYLINYKVDSGRVVQSIFNSLPVSPNTDTSRTTRYYFYECQ
jgi:YD repeat-containing protein